MNFPILQLFCLINQSFLSLRGLLRSNLLSLELLALDNLSTFHNIHQGSMDLLWCKGWTILKHSWTSLWRNGNILCYKYNHNAKGRFWHPTNSSPTQHCDDQDQGFDPFSETSSGLEITRSLRFWKYSCHCVLIRFKYPASRAGVLLSILFENSILVLKLRR